jgi:hypothetical protein
MTDTYDLIRTWPTDPAERLRALLNLYRNRSNDDLAIDGAYADGNRLVLTWGDLRAIAEKAGA